MYNIHLTTLTDVVVKLANESPDHVYAGATVLDDGCSYVGTSIGLEGGSGCIIGQALMRLGVPREDLRDWETANRGETGFDDLYVAEDSPVKLDGTYAQLNFLANIQLNQDAGIAWKQAVELAGAE